MPRALQAKSFQALPPGSRIPLSALLSQTLVAFIIEFDNEFERQTPHRTTDYGQTSTSRAVPWLVSMAMWLRFMRFVPPEGISVGELHRLNGLETSEFKMTLLRMSEWWGYVKVEPIAAEVPARKSGAGWIVRPTPGGQKALDVWRPLTAAIEERWRERFGAKAMDRLGKALTSLVKQFDDDLPDSLPILGYDLLSKHVKREPSAAHQAGSSLPELLAKTLLAFALEFEGDSRHSLAVAANVLRVVGEDGVLLKDIPRLSGVSKEAIGTVARRLVKHGLAELKPESPGSSAKMFVLTAAGRKLKDAYPRLPFEIEERWSKKYGGSAIASLRSALEVLAGDGSPQSPLFLGLTPYPQGWRAAVRKPETLPHYPMVLHRGGFPDGS